MPTTNYKYTTFNQTNGKHIPALSVEDVCSIQGKDIVWTFQLQPMQHRLQERPTQHMSVKQIKIWPVRLRMRLHLHQKNRCATTCQPQRQRQVIAKSNCYCIMSLCTASSKINCPAYLSSILHLTSSPCYCIPSTVLTCFLILCTSRHLKTQTNPASLVTPAPISLFPGMMAEEQPYTGTMSPGI